MHLNHVEIFCDVVARRSFSKAAEAAGISQSSASQAVQALEERLGAQLIDRSKRPLELTAAGEIYFEGCRDLLDSFRRIEDRVLTLQDKVTGRVRVAAIYSVGLLQMGAYARRFRESYPDAELELDYLHPDEVYNRVLGDEADLGLVSFPREGGSLSSLRWQDQPMVLVVPPGHALAGSRKIRVSELAGENYVGFTDDLTIRRALDRWLRQAHVSVNVVHEFDNIENIKRAVEIGAGVAILPEPTVRREIESGVLCQVRLADVRWTRPLGIVHRRNKTLSTAASRFVEILLSDEDAATESREAAPRTGKSHNGKLTNLRANGRRVTK
jgi:DNA-binding transcriptional LysR family regulator